MSSFLSQIFNFNSAQKKIEIPTALTELGQTETKAGRDRILEKMVERVWEESKHWPFVDFRQFAQMHTKHYLKGLSIDGSDPKESINFWLQILTLWKTGEGVLFPLECSPEQLDKVIEELSSYREFLEISQLKNSLKAASLYQQKIRNRLEEKGHCYVPFGWQSQMNSGHAFPCLFVRERDSVVVHILNKGSGTENHPLLWNEDSIRGSCVYRYPPIRISSDDLFGELGRSFFLRSTLLRTTSGDKFSEPYSAEDIYDALRIIGKVQTYYKTSFELTSAKPQEGNNCGDMSIRLLIRDFLLTFLNYPKEKYKWFSFNGRVCSLLAAVHRCEYEEACQMVIAATRELALAVDKRAPKMEKDHPQELIFCHALLRKIEEELIKKERQLYEACDEIDLSNAPITFNSHPVIEDLRCLKINTRDDQIDFILKENDLVREFTPLTFLPLLENWAAKLKSLKSFSSWDANFTTTLLFCTKIGELPIPHLSQDTWDLIPIEQIPACLQLLSEIVLLSQHSNAFLKHTHSCSIPIFLATATAYAIGDKLSRRIPEKSRLNGFYSPYPLHDLPFEQMRRPNLVELGEEAQRFEQLDRYFRGIRSQHRQRAFYFAPMIEIGEMVNGLRNKSLPLDDKGEAMLFLKQFIPEFLQHHSPPSAEEAYTCLWINKNQNSLPPIVGSIQTLAFALHNECFGRGAGFNSLEEIFDLQSQGINGILNATASLIWPPSKDDISKTKRWDNFLTLFLSEQSRSPTSSCFDLPSSVNEVFCLSDAEIKNLFFKTDSTPLEIKRQLLLVRCTRDLQPCSIIGWAKNNISLMTNEQIQNHVKASLFRPALLQNFLLSEPSFIHELRKWIEEGLEAYASRGPNQATHLFFLKTGYLIETHVLEVYGNQFRSQQHIDGYRHRLKQLDSAKAREAFPLTYSHYREFMSDSTEELSGEVFNHVQYTQSLAGELIKEWFKASSDNPRTLSSSDGFMIQRLLLRVQLSVRKIVEKDPSTASFFCKNGFEALFPDAQNPDLWLGSYPLFKSGKYTIDFSRGRIHVEGTDPKLFFSRSEFFKSLGQEADLIESEEVLMRQPEGFTTKDGNIRFLHPEGRSLSIERKFRLGDQEEWYRYIGRETTGTKQDRACWQSLVNPNVSLITTASSKASLISKRDLGLNREIKLDRRGNETLLVRVNLDEWKESSLYLQLDALGSRPYTRCWVDPSSNSIALLEILDLNLSFERDPSLRGAPLLCKQYPGHWLAPHQKIVQFRGFPGLVVLTNGEKEEIVILPKNRFPRVKEGDFYRNVEWVKAETTAQGHFIYRVTKGKLETPVAEANLALAMLFANLMNYPEALEYLFRSRSCSISIPTAMELSSLHDNSPEGLAFYLRAALYFIDRANELTDQFYRGFVDVELWQKLPNILSEYFKAIRSIPSYIRLSCEEEKQLLIFSKEIFKEKSNPSDQQNNLSRFLDLRLQLLTSPNGYFGINIHNLIVSKTPRAFKELGMTDFTHAHLPEIGRCLYFLPRDFTRIQENAIVEHFGFFYDQARLSPKEKVSIFDLDLLYLTKSCSHENTRALLALLYFIRHNAEQFQDIPPPSTKAEFSEIIAKASGLLNEMRRIGASFKDKANVVVLYNLGKIVYLKLPPPIPSPILKPISFRSIVPSNTKFFPLLLYKSIYDSSPSQKRLIDFYLEDRSLTPATAIEQLLFDQLTTGYAQNNRVVSPLYLLKRGVDICTIHSIEQKKLEVAVVELSMFRAKIETLANQLTEETDGAHGYEQILQDYQTHIKRTARLQPCVTIDHLIELFINKKLEQKNLLISLKNYLIAAVALDQQREVVALLGLITRGKENPQSIQDLGKVLQWKRLYDPDKFPQLLVYEYLSQKRLQADQVDLLQLIFGKCISNPDHRQALVFAFRAGGGKTSVLLPILMISGRLAGFLPLSITTAPLYNIERENQRSTLINTFRQSLSVFELKLEHSPNGAVWKKTYEKFKEGYEKGRGFICVPEAYHALHLNYLLALKAHDEESIKWLSLILLDFFPKHGLALIDESHRNLDPLTQADIGIGTPSRLPPRECALLVALYKGIAGWIPNPLRLRDGRLLADVIRLLENQQAALCFDDQEESRAVLAQYMATHPLLELSQKETAEITSFWLDEASQPPHFLEQMYNTDRERAETIALMRHCLAPRKLFCFAMEKVGEVDYAPSARIGEEFETPSYRKRPSTTQFKDPYVTAMLTIQGCFQRGLNVAQIDRLIKKLQSLHLEEMSHGAPTPSSQLFQKWTKDPSIDLMNISTEEETLLMQQLRNKSGVIEWYLEHILLPSVPYAKDHMISTSAHLVHGFNRSISFSATPGLPQLYPANPVFKDDSAFLESVTRKLSLECHEKIVFDSLHRDQFFEEIYDKSPHFFQRGRAIIDAGGALRDSGNTEEIARAFLELVQEKQLNYDGVLFFKEGEEDALVFLSSPKEEPIEFQSGNVVTEFSQVGIDWNNSKILVLFDPSHTTAANIPLPADALGLLLLGEGLSLQDTIQAAMRLRKFLDSQQLIWGLSKHVAKMIQPDKTGNLSSKAIIHWTLKNQEKKLEEGVTAAAYQQIEYLIYDIVKKELTAALNNPSLQIRIFERSKKGLIQPYILSHYERVATPISSLPTSTVLSDFAESCYKRYGFDGPLPRSLKTQVSSIAQQTEQLIQSLPTRPYHSLSQTAHMHQTQEQESEQNQVKITNCALVPQIPNLTLPNPFDPDFLGRMIARSRPAQTIFSSQSLTQGLHYTENALQTVSSGGTPLGQRYLKPANYILLVIDRVSPPAAFVLSDDEAPLLRQKLIAKNPKHPPHKIVMVNINGWIVQNGHGALLLPLGEQQKVVASTWFYDVITDASLIHGQLRFERRLIERLPQWSDFWEFWERVLKSHPAPNTIQKSAIERLIPPSLKKPASAAPQKSEPTGLRKFFNWFNSENN